MNCYLCRTAIPEDQSFYNDQGHQVCVPCFKEAPRCFVCRFPGRELQEVEGLGRECELCRGNLVGEGMELLPLIKPVLPFLELFGLSAPQSPRFTFCSREALRDMQTGADLPPFEFIDDFLSYCYPVFYDQGAHHCLRRMTKATFIVYAIIQLVVAKLAEAHGLPNLSGETDFHTFARGYCHYVGWEAAQRLKYDLERRQLRKWPQLGAQGDFKRWETMSSIDKPAGIARYFHASLGALARQHLPPPGAP